MEPLSEVAIQQMDPHELLPSGVPAGIHNALVNTLGIDPDEVTLAASWTDLGIESIDMLDIGLKIERAYDIEISLKDIHPVDLLEDSAYVNKETHKINEQGIALLRQRMPYADFSQLTKEPYTYNFDQCVWTVGLLKRYLEHRGVKFR